MTSGGAAPGDSNEPATVDRIIGAVLILTATVYAAVARGYTVSFVADPLGPRAAPFLLAALLFMLGLWLALRPGPAHNGTAHPGAPRRTVLVIVTFITYAALLPWTGFVLSTALLCGAMAWLAAGPVMRATALGAAFAGALYYLFVFALDVPLPVGRIFPFLGG